MQEEIILSRDKTFNLEIKAVDVTIIEEALIKLPYEKVADLLNDIRLQVFKEIQRQETYPKESE